MALTLAAHFGAADPQQQTGRQDAIKEEAGHPGKQAGLGKRGE